MQDLAGIRILIIENNAVFGLELRLEFEQQGAKVVFVDSVDQAIATLNANSFDLIISNIKLIGDGHNIIQTLRSQERSQDLLPVPVMILTGSNSAIDQKQAIAASFQSYFSKPIKAETVVAEAIRLLGTKK